MCLVRAMTNISTTSYLLESVIDNFQCITSNFDDIGRKVEKLSEKLDITNKYDRNMINFIKVKNIF